MADDVQTTKTPWEMLRASVLGLWCSDLNVVSSYDIATMRHNCFANLWRQSFSMEG
jgi:hypothetical protein